MHVSCEQKSSLGSDGYCDRNYDKQYIFPKQKSKGKNQLGIDDHCHSGHELDH